MQNIALKVIISKRPDTRTKKVVAEVKRIVPDYDILTTGCDN